MSIECRCEIAGKRNCPLHLRVYKLRYADGTYALKGIYGPPGSLHGGKAWTTKGNLKNAISYHNEYDYKKRLSPIGRPPKYAFTNRIIERGTKEGWVVVEISGSGIREMSIQEFMAL